MNSWWRSACYPRSTFYPLSDGDSTFHRRITKPYFHTCSTCWSRSQLPFYFYAQLAITNRDEGSFGLLRYSLGGYRPSKAARLTLSAPSLQRVALDPQLSKTSISPSTPLCLTTEFQRLLAILHMHKVKGPYQSTVKVHGVFPSYSG